MKPNTHAARRIKQRMLIQSKLKHSAVKTFRFIALLACEVVLHNIFRMIFFDYAEDDVVLFLFQKRVVNVYRLDTGKLVLKQQIHLLSVPIAFLHYECTETDCALVRTIYVLGF